MKRGRLERLDEALRQPDRKAIADPAALDPPDLHLQVPRLDLDPCPGMRAKLGFGRGGVDEARRKDIAIAAAVGQRDVPRPPRRQRRCPRRRFGSARRHRGRHDHCAVVEEIVAEAAMRLAQRAFDDRRAEAARVDEQLALDPPPVVRDQRGDKPVADRPRLFRSSPRSARPRARPPLRANSPRPDKRRNDSHRSSGTENWPALPAPCARPPILRGRRTGRAAPRPPARHGAVRHCGRMPAR